MTGVSADVLRRAREDARTAVHNETLTRQRVELLEKLVGKLVKAEADREATEAERNLSLPRRLKWLVTGK